LLASIAREELTPTEWKGAVKGLSVDTDARVTAGREGGGERSHHFNGAAWADEGMRGLSSPAWMEEKTKLSLNFYPLHPLVLEQLACMFLYAIS
jgi:hypothetical protein